LAILFRARRDFCEVAAIRFEAGFKTIFTGGVAHLARSNTGYGAEKPAAFCE
jgi:hypothetical protein